jgi:hypothetical protein
MINFILATLFRSFAYETTNKNKEKETYHSSNMGGTLDFLAFGSSSTFCRRKTQAAQT